MPSATEHYLGDGLYVKFDGFSITLRAPRLNGDHWVGIEPDVWRELIRFVGQEPQRRLFSTEKRSYIASGQDGEAD